MKADRKTFSLKRLLWQTFRFLLLLYVLAAIGCAAFQRKLLYYPTVEAPAASQQRGHYYHLTRWTNAFGRNIGWKRLVENGGARGEVLITHGNGGCAADRSVFAAPLHDFSSMDVFILEYPGFGDRDGTPSQLNLFNAAEEAFTSMPRKSPVYLLGESLGTGVASYLAGAHPQDVAGVLLFAPYNRLTDVAQHHVRILPARWLMADHFPSAEYLSRYHGPLAIVVGDKDRVIPEKYSRRLFDDYTGAKRLWEIPGGGHNTIQQQPKAFWNDVAAFWESSRSH